MLKESNMSESSLSISYLINSSMEKIYSCWTEKNMILPWMGGSNVKVNRVEIDLQVDGSFEFEMESPDGLFIAFGEYRELEPEKLVFSWGWRESMIEGSLMTVKLEPTEEGVLLNLLQEQLPTEKAVKDHMEGWLRSLDKLEKFLT